MSSDQTGSAGGTDRWGGLTKVAGVVLLCALVGVFVVTAVALVLNANEPPRLADLAPTAAPTALEATPSVVEGQRRGAYDPNERLLGLLAIVTPLVTTMVAYYFGQEKGATQAKQARQEQSQTIDTAVANLPDPAAQMRFLDELRKKNITVRRT